MKKDTEAQDNRRGPEVWAVHDWTEFVAWSKAKRGVFPNLKPSTKTISLRAEAEGFQATSRTVNVSRVLTLEVESPADNTTTSQRRITVSGRVSDPSAEVRVTGTPVAVAGYVKAFTHAQHKSRLLQKRLRWGTDTRLPRSVAKEDVN